jgi:hypothetical protein
MGFIERIDWPACSLDLNPKEHMWNEMQIRTAASQLESKTIQELVAMFVQEWAAKPV